MIYGMPRLFPPLAPIAIALMVAVGIPVRAFACSKVPYPINRSTRTLYFSGVARPDTVLAGPDTVTITGSSWSGGHAGSGQRITIYGQLFHVGRVASTTDSALTTAIAAAGHEVILVPWDYDPACRTLPYSASARWVQSSEVGFFHGVLRDRAHWIGGRPTLDVFDPFAEPYPTAIEHRGRVVRAHGAITPDELLDLISSLPEGIPGTAEQDLEPLHVWATRHERLAKSYPAVEIISRLEYDNMEARTAAIVSPLAGTYRLTVRFKADDSVVVLVRTARHPSSMLRTLSGSTTEVPPSSRLPVGYYLTCQVTERSSDLTRPYDDVRDQLGYLAASTAPIDSSADSTVWLGSADIEDVLSQQVTQDHRAVLQRLREVMFGGSYFERHTFLPGRFLRNAAGQIRYEQVVEDQGTRYFTITGERISSGVLDTQ